MDAYADFCGIRLEPAPYADSEWVFMGPDPDALLAYYACREAYDYENFDVPETRHILPEQVGGIFLSDHDLRHPGGFWSAHKKDGTFASFRMAAGSIRRVRGLLDGGLGIDDLPRGGLPRLCAELYFRKPASVPVVDMGTFYLFQSNGRHRLIAAMGLGYDLPVSVVGSMARKT